MVTSIVAPSCVRDFTTPCKCSRFLAGFARIVVALITLLIPGAGPPPTRIAGLPVVDITYLTLRQVQSIPRRLDRSECTLADYLYGRIRLNSI
jgi:hypothetical protein